MLRCYVKSPTVQDVFWPVPGLISCAGAIGRWGLLSHSQNAVRWLALSKRSVEAPIMHDTWSMSAPCHAFIHAAHFIRCMYHVLCHTHIMYAFMHETCRNTCISCTVYIEMFSLDTFLHISLVNLHSWIKNYKHMSLLHVSTWQAHCTVAYRENKISWSKFLQAFVKYYCEICCSVLWYSTEQQGREDSPMVPLKKRGC